MVTVTRKTSVLRAESALVFVLSAWIGVVLGGEAVADPVSDARQILATTGVKGGLIVHVGCGDGELTAALRANDSYLVHGLDADADQVSRAREHVWSLGLYGQVSVEPWAETYLPYVDNLVNLVVSEDLGEISMDEVMRVLAPNGVAYIMKGDSWTKSVKPRPDEIDEWTHYLHDASNNAVSQDRVVGPPHHLQWVGGPKWARSHDHLASVSAVVSTGGRVFYIVDEGPTAAVALPAQWFLVARDAFNGVVLWKRPIGSWEGHLRDFRSGPAELARRLVAIGDRVYVTLGYGQPVTALDAATGGLIKTYEGTDDALEFVYHGGVLFVVGGEVSAQEAADAARRRGASPPAHNKRILAIKADTGDQLWTKDDEDTAELMPTTLAAANGRVFFQSATEVVCVDAGSGDELWHSPRPISLDRPSWSAPTLVVYDNVVLSADRAVSDPNQGEEASADPTKVRWTLTSQGGQSPPGDLIAYSARTGKRLWDAPCREVYNAPADVLVADGLVWTGDLVKSTDPGITAARDPATGEIRRERPADENAFEVGMTHHRCYRNKATSRYLVLGRAGVEFIELTSGEAQANHWVRGTCQYGVLPCNGLLYAPPHSCACYIQAKLNGFNALAPRRSSRPAEQASAKDRRLERGPAYGSSVVSAAGANGDWPTLRGDPGRSGCTTSAVPANLERIWNTSLRGKLSSVVIADDKVFVSQIDAHTVHALDAGNGKSIWSYTAGGRVDSPPTIYRGLALFGAADGWVYCLHASDGQLAWRFRAAPVDQRVVAYGRVESVWPVSGSVLVQNDVAYVAAGRSSFLDGGIYLHRLDPRTGEHLSETCVNSRDPVTGAEPQDIIERVAMAGALPDVLSSDGTSVYMRHTRFDLAGVEQAEDVPHLHSSVGFLDDTWWHRTYWFIGTKMGSGYGGWPGVGNQVPAGRLLVSEGSYIYGFGREQYAHHGSHIDIDAASIWHFRPGRDENTRYTRYHLFAVDKNDARVKMPPRKPASRPAAGRKRPQPPGPEQSMVKFRWSEELPFFVRAMVLADGTLFVAGPPDIVEPDNPSGAFEGRKGASLWSVSASSGQQLSACQLESSPVFDGMAAAGGRLYLATMDGKVSCFAGKR